MQSRYDIMTESSQVDSSDFESYPDPLSVNWRDFEISSAPFLTKIESRYINKLWLLLLKVYNRTDMDDVIFTLNNVPYRKLLTAGDDFFLPVAEDLTSFYATQIAKKRG
jgi:hypothetical protein